MEPVNKVRNYAELGVNLQKIVNRLMENNNLVNLLYYQDKDPLSQPHLTKEEKQQNIFQKRILIIPKMNPQELAESTISVTCIKSTTLGANNEFLELTICVEVFVPITQWIIKDSNLRPYAILGEVQRSLDGKIINGLGRMSGGDFEYNFGSNEMTHFIQIFTITNYD